MSNLKLFLLGPPRVELGHTVVDIRRRKTLALLVYLAVTKDSQRRDTLATLLWPDASQRDARASLSRDLSVLKKLLGESWLAADRETVILDHGSQLWVDSEQFEQWLAGCQSHHPSPQQECTACLETLAEAVTLYRADFLSGFTLSGCPAFDDWQSFQTEGFRRELAVALERLVDAYSTLGDAEAAIPYARRWLSLDPLHEPAHRALMALYFQTGDRAAAIRQYQDCVQVLAAELDVPPADETTALYDRIRTEVPGPTKPMLPVARHNLPSPPTPFIGRAGELGRIARRLADPACRLLTLAGPGGIGKTRLALQAANDLVEASAGTTEFSHGVYFASLAPVSSSDSLVAAIAEAIGFSFYRGVSPRQQLLDYLREKEMLLILDNFEHLLIPSVGEEVTAAALVSEILVAAPLVKILITSREALNLHGEWLYPVAGLSFPPDENVADKAPKTALADYSAVQLFEQCARRANPDYSAATAEACVARICRLVEGMPLAIELAAAWLKMFPCDKITRELERGLDFLATSLKNVPDRHRSVQAVFEHSWQLLSEAEQAVFRQLSVFQGGFLQEAAEQVAGATFAELVALVDKSLLRLNEAGRYEIHELLRQFTAEKLEQVPAVAEAARDRHSAYYCAFLQQRETDLKGARQKMAMEEIEVELGNVRLAWHRAVAQGQIEQLAQAIESLGIFYEWRGRFQEAEAAFRLAAERLAGPETGDDEYRILARVLAWQGHLNQILGRLELTGQLLEQSHSLLDNLELSGQDIRSEKAFVLRVMTTTLFSIEEERHLHEQSLDLYRALGDRWGMAGALASLTHIACWGSVNYDQAKQLGEESLALRKMLGDERGIAHSFFQLSEIAVARGQPEEAEQLARESLALRRELDDQPGVAKSFLWLGMTLIYAGKFAEARHPLEENLQIENNLGNRKRAARATEQLALLEIYSGRYQQARSLVESALPIFQEIGEKIWAGVNLIDLGMIALAEQKYGEASRLLAKSVATLRDTGRQVVLGESLAFLACAERGLGHTLEAQQYLSEALRITAEGNAALPLWDTLPAVALLLVDRGEPERAMEVYALASRNPYIANSRWFEDIAGRHIAAVAATLPPKVVATAQERGQARNLWETARELLIELEE